MKIFKFSMTVVATGIALLVSQGARAAASFDSLGFKPADDHGFYLVNQQSRTLGRRGYALGLTTEFSNDSLALKNAAGARIQSIINNQVATQLGAALGLTDWLNVGVNVSSVPWQQFTPIGSAVESTGAHMGDILLDAKARLLDNEKHAVGIALVPFVTIPTGSDSHFVGNGKFTGGGLAVLDTKRFGDRVSLALNAGAQLRNEVALSPGTVTGHQFLHGAAANVGIVKEKLEAIADVSGRTNFDSFFQSNNRTLEVNGGLRFYPTARLAVTAGGGAGILNGPGSPDYRAFVTVAYRHPREEGAAPPPKLVAQPVEEVITTNLTHFAFDKSAIRPESYPVLDKILAAIQGRPEVQAVRVEGHADSVGSDAYNLELSDQRANSVRNYMVERGYPVEKITSVGMGESSPIADNGTKAGRAKNRRVEFHLQISPSSRMTVKERTEDSPTFEEGDHAPERK